MLDGHMERSRRSGTSEAMNRHDDVKHQASSPGKQTLTQSLGHEATGAPMQRAAVAQGSQDADSETTRRAAASGVAAPGSRYLIATASSPVRSGP